MRLNAPHAGAAGRWMAWAAGLMLWLLAASAYAHGVSESDKGFLQGSTGMHLLPYMYLGAKHMVTGYDPLLFLCGVIFFLYRMAQEGAADAAGSGRGIYALPEVGVSSRNQFPQPDTN